MAQSSLLSSKTTIQPPAGPHSYQSVPQASQTWLGPKQNPCPLHTHTCSSCCIDQLCHPAAPITRHLALFLNISWTYPFLSIFHHLQDLVILGLYDCGSFLTALSTHYSPPFWAPFCCQSSLSKTQINTHTPGHSKVWPAYKLTKMLYSLILPCLGSSGPTAWNANSVYYLRLSSNTSSWKFSCKLPHSPTFTLIGAHLCSHLSPQSISFSFISLHLSHIPIITFFLVCPHTPHSLDFEWVPWWQNWYLVHPCTPQHLAQGQAYDGNVDGWINEQMPQRGKLSSPESWALSGLTVQRIIWLPLFHTQNLLHERKGDRQQSFKRIERAEFGTIFRLSCWSYKCTKMGKSYRVCGSQQYYI